MSQSIKPTPLSYADAARILSDSGVREDVSDACTNLTQAMGLLIQRLGVVAKQLHTIDLQRLTTPLKPQWDGIWKHYTEVLTQYRANAGYISARLKLFCSSVLPVASRSVADDGLRRSQEEAIHVLQSFTAISAEHASQTRLLLGKSVQLIREMVSFHTSFSQVVYPIANSGQAEIKDLSMKTAEVEIQFQHVCKMNMSLSQVSPTFTAYTTLRLVTGFGKKPGRSKLSNQPLALSDAGNRISQAFDSLSTKRNEFAHAEYCAQIRIAQNDLLARVQTSVALLISDALHYFEHSLTFYFSVWLRLQSDCHNIVRWVKDPNTEVPPVVSIYQVSGRTLYASLSQSLDTYITGLDPSTFSQGP